MKKLNYLIIAVLLFGVNIPVSFAQSGSFGDLFGEFALPMAAQLGEIILPIAIKLMILSYALFVAIVFVVLLTKVTVYWVSNGAYQEKIRKTIAVVIGYITLMLVPYIFYVLVESGDMIIGVNSLQFNN